MEQPLQLVGARVREVLEGHVGLEPPVISSSKGEDGRQLRSRVGARWRDWCSGRPATCHRSRFGRPGPIPAASTEHHHRRPDDRSAFLSSRSGRKDSGRTCISRAALQDIRPVVTINGYATPGAAGARVRATLILGNQETGHRAVQSVETTTDSFGFATFRFTAGGHVEEATPKIDVSDLAFALIREFAVERREFSLASGESGFRIARALTRLGAAEAWTTSGV